MLGDENLEWLDVSDCRKIDPRILLKRRKQLCELQFLNIFWNKNVNLLLLILVILVYLSVKGLDRTIDDYLYVTRKVRRVAAGRLLLETDYDNDSLMIIDTFHKEFHQVLVNIKRIRPYFLLECLQ